jgi:hypothetical protein
MVMLVTLAAAKDHLRIDNSDDDNDLTLKIHAASGAVLNYIRNGADEFTDSSGEPILDSNGVPVGIPFEIQAATLLLLGYLFKDRDGDPDKAFTHNYLPMGVISLLTFWRDPTLR